MTVRISKAAAEQRAGRAGRTAPGVAIRLWTEALHRGLPPADRPEILEAELSGLALDLAAWGAAPGDLAFLDPPPAGTLAAGRALLRELDALDAEGRITAMGRAMARMGTHPRLARMLLAATDEGRRRWPPTSPRCWRNATPSAGGRRRATSICGWNCCMAATTPTPTAPPSSASAAPPRCTGGG